MQSTAGLNAKKATLRQGQPSSLQSTSADTEMNTSNMLNKPSDNGTFDTVLQDILSPLVALIDKTQFAQTLGQAGGYEIMAVRLPVLESPPAMPGETFVDHDFFGELCDRAGMVHDCPSSGFQLQRLHVCDRRNTSPGHPTNHAVEGFDRYRMAGVDGVARVGDRDAGTVIYSRSADSFMHVKRDGLAPKRISFSEFCTLLAMHRKALAEVSA
ncbi:hypothetical protein [Pseudomonas syringae]|uniref:hypothetical protein n=1 Tax=Pseudomonas syringae TaxID=317 RepID=UPI0012ADD3CA|nr:hypothetical protein [Pseudomonas syringae]